MPNAQPDPIPDEPVALGLVAATYADAFDLLFALPSSPDPDVHAIDLSNWASMGADTIGPLLHSKVALYLTDATEMLRGIAAMLSMGTGGSCAPMARAVAERAGRVNWLLEADLGDSRKRAARVALEHARGLDAYRVALDRLGSPAADTVTGKLREWRDSMETWFPGEVEKDPDEPKVASKWVVVGERLPDALEEQRWLPDGLNGGDPTVAAAAYAALCGLTHPNDLFLREHLTENDAGKPVFEYSWVYMDKLLRAAAHAYASALKHAASYYGNDSAMVEYLDLIGDQHDEVTAGLETIPTESAE